MRLSYKNLLIGALIFLGLYLSSLYSYLLFHTLSEAFSIAIAFVIFTIVWNSQQFLKNKYLAFLGISFLFTGFIDLIHTMSYQGITIFEGYGTNLPTQLWITARYIQGLSFLIAPLFFRLDLKIKPVILGYSIACSILIAAIFAGIFPVCFVEGVGLSLFKKVSEYIISAILLSSIVLLLRYRDEFDPIVLRWITLSIVFTIVSELAFTLYVDAYGISNMVGHYLKIISVWFIYKGLIETALKKPYSLLFRELKESEERYQSLFSHMINGFAYHKVIFDAKGNPVDYIFLDVNQAFEDLTGLKREDLLGKRVKEVLPGIDKDPADWIGRYGRVATTGEWARIEEYAMIFDRWYSIIAYSPKKDYFVTVFEDVTQRKQSEETLIKTKAALEATFKEKTAELFRTNELLHTIIDHIPAMLFICDSSGKVKVINKEFERIAGRLPDEALGMDLMNAFHLEPVGFEEMWSYFKETTPGWRDFPLKNREGNDIVVSWASAGLSDGSIIGIGIDITEQKRAAEKLAKYMEQLERSNREFQEFAYVASHDLQEPLRKIRTFGEMLKTKEADYLSENARDYIDRMQRASTRMQHLIDSLLTYSRVSTRAKPFSSVNLNEVVKDVLANLELLISERNALVELDELPFIEADNEQMVQLFQNLIVNALKFCREGHPPRIKIYSRKVKQGTPFKPGEYEICIEDDGIGFEEEYLDRIFMPFQRLHGRDLYQGEGMGLAICKKIVERHKGTITARSAVNKGSVFILTLPERQTWR